MIQNPFSVTQNTEKEVKNIFDMMQSDSKKKRKMVNFMIKLKNLFFLMFFRMKRTLKFKKKLNFKYIYIYIYIYKELSYQSKLRV